MTAEYIPPLQLDYIFKNIFAGSPDVFFSLFLVGFSILAGMFKMNGFTFLILYALASIMLYNWLGGGLFLITTFLAGLIVFYRLSKLIKN